MTLFSAWGVLCGEG